MPIKMKHRDMRRTAARIAGGFVHGIVQMAAFGQASAIERFPSSHSATAALRSDWRRLGGDMQRAIEKEEQRVKTEA